MRFAHSICSASALAFNIVTIGGQGGSAEPEDSLVPIPIAMITHYSDSACSTLDVGTNFHLQDYYRNPDAKPGTAEANYTYFCDRAMVPYGSYGIYNIDTCHMNNGGNWYYQPLGFCTNFMHNNDTTSIEFTSIDHTTRITIHSVYSDLDCAVQKFLNEAANSSECYADKHHHGFVEVGLYQFIIPDAHNFAGAVVKKYVSTYAAEGDFNEGS